MPQNLVLYQAYGHSDIINECCYALLRWLAVYRNTALSVPAICVYTDRPEAFAAFKKLLPLHTQSITSQEIARWKGNIQFVHRVKIEIILHALQNWNGNLLYCDTDTYPLQPVADLLHQITDKQVVMHVDEGDLAQPQSKHLHKWKRFLQQSPNLPFTVSPLHQFHMWNAGVIRINKYHLPLVRQVLQLTDALYPLFPKHTVEQFAFCHVFQKEGLNIVPASEKIFHYWDLKEFRVVLKKFFETAPDDVEQWLQWSHQWMPEKLAAEKNDFKRSSALTKAIKRLQGKQWRIEQYLEAAKQN